MSRVFIKLDGVTLRVRDRLILPDTTWEIRKGQHWAVLGPNGSGKSSLVRALAGGVPIVRGGVTRNYPSTVADPIGFVSLELHQRIIAREEGRDAARAYSGRLDTLEKVRETVMSGFSGEDDGASTLKRVAARLEIGHLLDRPVRFLSSGEMRKVLIARAAMKSPQTLILDEPFAGLDQYARQQLIKILQNLIQQGIQLILVTHRFEEIIPEISHVICLKDCTVFLQGRCEKVLTAENMKRLYESEIRPACAFTDSVNSHRHARRRAMPPALITIKNTTVRYGDVVVLNRLNWTMRQGENWAVLGPNGSGKSTFLELITGDNPQAYANEIYLFGKRKGSGESVGDIKKRIGIISSELQVHYRKRIRSYDVVLSGFHDSIGLYRSSSAEQHAGVRHWMARLGIGDHADTYFDQLSYGQRRMVLLARAMVKSPAILILDEPCEGLDQLNRTRILGLVDDIGRLSPTQILFVTHHRDEIPSCIDHVLNLEKPIATDATEVQEDQEAAHS